MKRFLNRMWQEEDGVLSFEWVLLLTLLVIGIVGGLAAARDAMIDELGDVAEATINLDQSYFLAGYTLDPDGVPNNGDEIVVDDVTYTDDTPTFTDDGRTNLIGQVQGNDGAS